MNFLCRWSPFPLWFETTWMPVPRRRYDLLEAAFIASEKWNEVLVAEKQTLAEKLSACQEIVEEKFATA